MTQDEPKAILQQFAQGNILRRDELESAIATLEKQFNARLTFADLTGEWRLLWTSGTKNTQKMPFRRETEEIHLSQRSPIVQIFDRDRIENKVYFPIGCLSVAGTCRYTDSKRLYFTFSQLSLKLGAMPPLNLPFGSWATGWLQTTYLDTEYHIERGDRGGVSLYQKI